jgi:hypothetical protein
MATSQNNTNQQARQDEEEEARARARAIGNIIGFIIFIVIIVASIVSRVKSANEKHTVAPCDPLVTPPNPPDYDWEDYWPDTPFPMPGPDDNYWDDTPSPGSTIPSENTTNSPSLINQ